jgi:integrase
MGRQHIRNGELVVRQGKTGAQLTLPIVPELQKVLDATRSEHMTFLVGKGGRLYRGPEFSGQFRIWCDEAGLPKGCTFHGLRATGCTKLADNGCSAHEIAAWSGHMTLKEVERYTRSASRQHAISDPRHQPAIDYRHLRVLRLHSSDQRGCRRPLQPCDYRDDRSCTAGS